MEIELNADAEWSEAWGDEFWEELDNAVAAGARLLLAADELAGSSTDELDYSDLREATGMEQAELVEWEAELRRRGLVGEGTLAGFGLTHRGIEAAALLREAD